MIQMKRAYEPVEPEDGYRVLVDRLWPRGVSKENARLDAWAKEISPSNELRRWYDHDPEKWDEFRERYARELQTPEGQATLDELADLASKGTVTLIYSSHGGEISNAAALMMFIRDRMRATADE